MKADAANNQDRSEEYPAITMHGIGSQQECAEPLEERQWWGHNKR